MTPHILILPLETFDPHEVQAAVDHALALGAIGFDAVKHLVLCRVEKRPRSSTSMSIPICPGPPWARPRRMRGTGFRASQSREQREGYSKSALARKSSISSTQSSGTSSCRKCELSGTKS